MGPGGKERIRDQGMETALPQATGSGGEDGRRRKAAKSEPKKAQQNFIDPFFDFAAYPNYFAVLP